MFFNHTYKLNHYLLVKLKKEKTLKSFVGPPYLTQPVLPPLTFSSWG